MNRQIAGKYNTGDGVWMANINLPIEVWNVVLGYMNKAELGRVRMCCRMFNELEEICRQELVFRELQIQENPLDCILKAYNRNEKFIEPFNYYIQRAILTQELLDKVLVGYDDNKDENTKSTLLALCDMTEPKRNNTVMFNNIEILNNAFQEHRYCFTYWHHLCIMVLNTNDCSLLCNFISLCEDALKNEKETGDFREVFRNITQKSQGNLSWLLEVLLKKFLFNYL